MTSSQGDHLETEQKYDADEDFVLPGLASLPQLGGRRGALAPEPKRYFLSATYYDTEDLDLYLNKITLRRRVGGPDEGWHLKTPVRENTRQERHEPLADGDSGTVPVRLAAAVEDVSGGKRLRPVAVLDTERTVITLIGTAGDALLEIADDRVSATKFSEQGDVSRSWREIEVEVMSDEDPAVPAMCEEVGKVLREAGARPSSSGSKLARLIQS